MKKLILLMLTVMLSSVVMAKSPITVKSGALTSLKDKKVYVEYDNSKMVVLDEDTKKEMTMLEFCQMKGDDWVRDMGKDDVDAQASFEEVLNKKGKFDVVADKSSADLVIVCQPTKFSYGNPVAIMAALMPKDTQGFFIGNFIVKTPDGSTVAELACNKVNAKGIYYSWTSQKCHIYEATAKELASYLNKVK